MCKQTWTMNVCRSEEPRALHPLGLTLVSIRKSECLTSRVSFGPMNLAMSYWLQSSALKPGAINSFCFLFFWHRVLMGHGRRASGALQVLCAPSFTPLFQYCSRSMQRAE